MHLLHFRRLLLPWDLLRLASSFLRNAQNPSTVSLVAKVNAYLRAPRGTRSGNTVQVEHRELGPASTAARARYCSSWLYVGGHVHVLVFMCNLCRCSCVCMMYLGMLWYWCGCHWCGSVWASLLPLLRHDRLHCWLHISTAGATFSSSYLWELTGKSKIITKKAYY